MFYFASTAFLIMGYLLGIGITAAMLYRVVREQRHGHRRWITLSLLSGILACIATIPYALAYYFHRRMSWPEFIFARLSLDVAQVVGVISLTIVVRRLRTDHAFLQAWPSSGRD